MGHWRADPKVWDKGAAGPVSEADFAVDRHLRARLLAARPDYGWLSEETADPIDGTRAYLGGEETWAHSLAVAEAGRGTAGVIFLPAKNRLYAAATGRGATRDGAAVAPSARTEVAGARVLSNRMSFDPRHWRVPPDDLARGFRPSLAYRLALVAEGRFDAMLTLGDAWEWDIAAGALIAAEAGAAVTDRHGAPLTFNAEGARAPGVLTAAPALHAALLSRLAPAL